jgi:hypothetical protein
MTLIITIYIIITFSITMLVIITLSTTTLCITVVILIQLSVTILIISTQSNDSYHTKLNCDFNSPSLLILCVIMLSVTVMITMALSTVLGNGNIQLFQY